MDGTLQGEQSYSGRALDKAYTSVSGDPGLLGTFSINTVKDLPRVNSSQTSTPNDHLSTTHTGTHTRTTVICCWRGVYVTFVKIINNNDNNNKLARGDTICRRTIAQRALRPSMFMIDRLWSWCRPYKLCNDLNSQPKRTGDLDLWPFDLESGVRVTFDVGYLCANFGLPRPLCSRVSPNVRDRRETDRRHASDVRQQHRLIIEQ